MAGYQRKRGHVRQRGAKWCVVVDVPADDGRRKQKWISGFESERDAQRALTEILHSQDTGVFVEPSKATLRAYLEDEWLPGTERTVRASTWATHKAQIRKHVVPHLGDLPLQQVTPARVNALYSRLLAAGLSASSVRRVHAVLRKALADAVRWNLIPRNPADAADPPRVVRPAMQTWSQREVRTFLAHVRDDRLFALYRLALATGMRRGEIVGLRWQDVDLDAARLAVVQQLVVVDGWRVEVSEPKTARGRRVLDLDPATVQALRAHRDVQIAERAFMGPDYEDNDLVFCREDGRALHPDKVSQAFTRLARAAGLPPIRFHDLRHTYATLALAAGEYPKVLSERLGHASAAFTLDTYAHVIPSMQQAAAERIAGVLDDA